MSLQPLVKTDTMGLRLERKMQKIDIVDEKIKRLYEQFDLGMEVSNVRQLAEGLNQRQIQHRIPWVKRLLDFDQSIGLCGFVVGYNERDFSFHHLLAFDEIFRPIKYVYMNICYTFIPAGFSRDIAENACAHVEQSFRLFVSVNRIFKNKPRDTLGRMLYSNRKLLDKRSDNLFGKISELNELIYGKTKHVFKVEKPREQLHSFTESLMIYFMARKIAVELFIMCKIDNKILAEIKNKAFFGQTWFIWN
jgi:hypothetical protein